MSPEVIAGIVIASIGLLAAPMGQLFSWLINRKKNVADVNAIITDSSLAAVEAMQHTMESLRIELEAAVRKVSDLQAEIIELKEQNIVLIHENSLLKGKVDALTHAMNDALATQHVSPDNTDALLDQQI